MKIFDHQETSIDFYENYSSILFLSGCNFSCPACYAKDIVHGNGRISEENFLDYIKTRRKFFDGVVLCGGEPTLQLNIVSFTRKLKDLGLSVKLDTNGSNFSVMQELQKSGTVDYVAMDIKSPANLYSRVTGRQIDMRDFEKGMVIATQFPRYEYRTTVVPVVRDSEISFLSPVEIEDMARWIRERTGKSSVLYLQKFVSKKGELINPELENFPETPGEILEQGRELAGKYLDVRIR